MPLIAPTPAAQPPTDGPDPALVASLRAALAKAEAQKSQGASILSNASIIARNLRAALDAMTGAS